MKDYTYDEQEIILQNMINYGGSFIYALADCYRRADIFNKRKLVTAFEEEFERYLKM